MLFKNKSAARSCPQEEKKEQQHQQALETEKQWCSMRGQLARLCRGSTTGRLEIIGCH